MTIHLTHNMGDITYNDITYNDITYNDFTCNDNTFNTQHGWHYLQWQYS
jgi:hypothetical protein